MNLLRERIAGADYAYPKTRRSKQNEAHEENPKERTMTYVTEGCRSATKLCVAYTRFILS